MEFSGQYLTYDEYKALGGTLDQTPFNLLEFEARKKIDERTQGRLKGVENIPQEVKICVFNLINSIKKYAESETSGNNEKNNIASESTDGYSVTYNTITLDKVQEIVKSKNAELNDTINTDLYGVIVNNEHILYLGVKQ